MIKELLATIGRACLERHPAYSQHPGAFRLETLGASVALYRGENLVAGAKDIEALAASIMAGIDGTDAAAARATRDRLRGIDPDDLTVAEVADSLGIKPVTVRAKLGRGEFDGAYQVGRDWRVPVSAVRDYRPSKPGRRWPAKGERGA